MAKIITGTKSHREAQAKGRAVDITKATGSNITKIRCTFCGTLAHPTPNAKGGRTLTCACCGRKFSVQKL